MFIKDLSQVRRADNIVHKLHSGFYSGLKAMVIESHCAISSLATVQTDGYLVRSILIDVRGLATYKPKNISHFASFPIFKHRALVVATDPTRLVEDMFGASVEATGIGHYSDNVASRFCDEAAI